MADQDLQSELTRLRKEQSKARQDEVFGGFSRAERAEYDARTKRIHDLGTELQTKGAERTIPEQQRRQWHKDSETDTPQNVARQPYRSREKDSGDAFTTSLKTGRGKRKNDSKEGSE
jgi:hypothetical protein